MRTRNRVNDRAGRVWGHVKSKPKRYATAGAVTGLAAVLGVLQATGAVNYASIANNFVNVDVDNSVTTDNSRNIDNSQNIVSEVVNEGDVYNVIYADGTARKFDSLEAVRKEHPEWTSPTSSSPSSQGSSSSTEPESSPTGESESTLETPTSVPSPQPPSAQEDAPLPQGSSSSNPTATASTSPSDESPPKAQSSALTATPTAEPSATATANLTPQNATPAPTSTLIPKSPAESVSHPTVVADDATVTPEPTSHTNLSNSAHAEAESPEASASSPKVSDQSTTSTTLTPTATAQPAEPSPVSTTKDEWDYRHDCLYPWRDAKVDADKGWFDSYNDTMNGPDIAFQMDHVVPKRYGLDHIADEDLWDAFKCDTDNIVFTTAQTNNEKSDKLPDEWMPPSVRVRGMYCETIEIVVERYDLPDVPCEVPATPTPSRNTDPEDVEADFGLDAACGDERLSVRWTPVVGEGVASLSVDNFDWWNEEYGTREARNKVVNVREVYDPRDDPGGVQPACSRTPRVENPREAARLRCAHRLYRRANRGMRLVTLDQERGKQE